MRSSRVTALGLALFAVALLTLGLASSASAAPDAYFEVGSFGQPSVGSGPGEFNEPRRADVYAATGELFVADKENNRVQVFSPSGNAATYLTEFGAGVLSQPFGIAIDQDNGDVYVSSAGSNEIVKFKRTVGIPPTFAPDPSFTSPAQGAAAGEIGSFEAALAIDQADGDLWVADPGNLLVQHFTSSGAYVDSFDGSSSPLGLFKRLTDIEIDGNGNVVIASDAKSNASSKARCARSSIPSSSGSASWGRSSSTSTSEPSPKR